MNCPNCTDRHWMLVEAKEVIEAVTEANKTIELERDALKASLQVTTQALEWYAAQSDEYADKGWGPESALLSDGGSRAREALAALKAPSEKESGT